MIEKDGRPCQNISIKFPCACPPVISSIFGKSFHFPFPYFVLFILRHFPLHVLWSECNYLYFQVKHKRLHKPQNQWEHTCNHCQAKFERLKDLMVHIDQVHLEDGNKEEYTGDKKWICRFCGKRISTKLSLQDHERIHTGAKPFMCEWCGREFRSRPNLLQHHLTHTGDRKHECGICKKRFARKSFITQHMRVHTGEKPYECDLCGKRFTQAGDMKRHRNRHLKPLEQGLSFYVQLQQ